MPRTKLSNADKISLATFLSTKKVFTKDNKFCRNETVVSLMEEVKEQQIITKNITIRQLKVAILEHSDKSEVNIRSYRIPRNPKEQPDVLDSVKDIINSKKNTYQQLIMQRSDWDNLGVKTTCNKSTLLWCFRKFSQRSVSLFQHTRIMFFNSFTNFDDDVMKCLIQFLQNNLQVFSINLGELPYISMDVWNLLVETIESFRVNIVFIFIDRKNLSLADGPKYLSRIKAAIKANRIRLEEKRIILNCPWRSQLFRTQLLACVRDPDVALGKVFLGASPLGWKCYD